MAISLGLQQFGTPGKRPSPLILGLDPRLPRSQRRRFTRARSTSWVARPSRTGHASQDNAGSGLSFRDVHDEGCSRRPGDATDRPCKGQSDALSVAGKKRRRVIGRLGRTAFPCKGLKILLFRCFFCAINNSEHNLTSHNGRSGASFDEREDAPWTNLKRYRIPRQADCRSAI